MKKFNPEMLLLARLSRGKTQRELAEDLGIPQGSVSRIQDGLLSFPKHLLQGLVNALGYPESFYYQGDRVEAAPTHFFRRRLSLGRNLISKVSARMNIVRMNVKRLLANCEELPVRVPMIDPSEVKGGSIGIARKLRLHWRVPDGPIGNLTTLLERAGCLIIPFDFETAKIDGCSDHVETTPVIFVNPNLCPTRFRFTLAHELGHLVMHQFPDDDDEDQANLFAGEFMMPGKSIRSSFVPMSIDRLASLKLHWRMSMQAILMRAEKLGVISKYRSRQMWTIMNLQGYRVEEPFEDQIPKETPELLRKLIRFHINDLDYSYAELSQKVNLFNDEFLQLYEFRPALRIA